MKEFKLYSNQTHTAPSTVFGSVRYYDDYRELPDGIKGVEARLNPPMAEKAGPYLVCTFTGGQNDALYACFDNKIIPESPIECASHVQYSDGESRYVFQGDRKVRRVLEILCGLEELLETNKSYFTHDDKAEVERCIDALTANITRTKKLPQNALTLSKLTELRSDRPKRSGTRSIKRYQDDSGTSYIFKPSDADRKESELEPAVAELYRWLLGPRRVPEMFCAVDGQGRRIGVLSEEFTNLQPLASYHSSSTFTSDQLLNGHAVEAYTFAFGCMENDLHCNNVFINSDGRIVLLDFDRSDFLITGKYCRNDPDAHQEYSEPFKTLPFTPRETFGEVTEATLREFPNLSRMPYYWANHFPVVRDTRGAAHKDFEDTFCGQDDVRYIEHQWFAFFKMAMMPKSYIEAVAKYYLASEKAQQGFIDRFSTRFQQIHDGLLLNDEFKVCFRKHHVAWFMRLKTEVEEFNPTIPDDMADRRTPMEGQGTTASDSASTVKSIQSRYDDFARDAMLSTYAASAAAPHVTAVPDPQLEASTEDGGSPSPQGVRSFSRTFQAVNLNCPLSNMARLQQDKTLSWSMRRHMNSVHGCLSEVFDAIQGNSIAKNKLAAIVQSINESATQNHAEKLHGAVRSLRSFQKQHASTIPHSPINRCIGVLTLVLIGLVATALVCGIATFCALTGGFTAPILPAIAKLGIDVTLPTLIEGATVAGALDALAIGVVCSNRYRFFHDRAEEAAHHLEAVKFTSAPGL